MSKQTGKRRLALLLSIAMVFGMLPSAASAAPTAAAAGEDAKWAELSAILKNMTGTYTEAPDLAASKLFTNGMLLGNGALGVVSDARPGEQSFYLSSNDGYSGSQKIMNAQLQITGEEEQPYVGVTANDRSSNAGDKDMGPQAVIDGDPLTYWVSNPVSRVPGPKWLVFTFHKPVTIDSWSSTHRGYMDTGSGYNNPRYNTRDFCLQTSEDGEKWNTVDDVVGNETHIVARTLTQPVTSRYFRVYITKPVQPGKETASVTGDREYARISEVDFLFQGKSILHTESVEEEKTRFTYSQTDGTGFNGSAANAFDGKPATFWRSNNQMEKLDVSKTIAVTSNKAFSFNELEILHYGTRYPDETQYNTYDYEVQIQVDGEWKTLETISGNTENSNRFAYDDPVSATGLRLAISKPVHPDYATKYRTNDMTYAMIYDVNILMDGERVIKDDDKDTAPFLHEQDIFNAEVRSTQEIDGESFHFSSWVDANKNLLITDVTLDEKASKEAKLFFQMKAPSTGGTSTTPGASDDILYVTRASSGSGDQNAYRFRVATALKVLGGDYTVQNGKGELIMSPGQTVRLVVYSHTSAGTTSNGLPYKEADTLLTEAKDYLNNTDAMSDETMKQARKDCLAWWKDYWLKSYIDIDDEVLQRYYYGALYGLGSTIRATPQGAEQPNMPGAMMGVWQTGDNASNGGRAFLNYNYEAPYYGLHSSNRSYLMEPYFEDVTRRLSYVQQSTAKNGYNGVSIVRTTLPVYPVYDLRTARTPVTGTKKPTGSGFADQKTNTMLYTQALLWDWQYDKNQDRLVKYIYNTVRDAVLFYTDFVVEKDGKYWVYNSASNERDGYGYDVNPAIDLGYITSHFNSFIKMIEEASELGVAGLPTLEDDKANLIPRLRDILDNLTPYPTNTNNPDTAADLAQKGFSYDRDIIMSAVSSNNGTQVKASGGIEWAMYIYEGNQPVPLEGLIHPAENVSLASDAGLLSLVRDTFEYYNPLYPYYRGGGYNGFAKSYTMAARLGMDGEELVNKLSSTIQSIWRENLTCMTSGHGIEVFGNVEAINSMLLQNEGDELRVFPAWAKSKDAKFVDLRAKNAFLVSAEYKADSGVSYVDILSEKGEPVRFVSPWNSDIQVVDSKGNTVNTIRSTTANTGEFLYTFATTAGETYTVTKGGALPENKIERLEINLKSNYLQTEGVLQAKAGIFPDDGVLKEVKWSSSDESVAVVNQSGLITGRAKGATTITVESMLDPTVKASIEIHVFQLDAVPGDFTKFNDNVSDAVYTGAWSRGTSRPGAYQSDSHYSQTTGDACSFSFTGTGVKFYSEKFTNCGKFEVWLDGEKVGMYDNYLDVDSAQRNTLSYSVDNLDYGPHVLKLVVAEEKYLLVDAFEVETNLKLDSLYEELSMISQLENTAYPQEIWNSYYPVWERAYSAYDEFLNGQAPAAGADALAQELKTARENLPVLLAKSGLKALIDEAEALDTGNCRPGKVTNFEKALAAAWDAYNDPNADLAAVTAATDTLLEAMLNLKDIVDRTELSKLVSLLEKLDETQYCKAGFDKLKEAIAQAKLLDDDASVKQVEDAYKALQKAYGELVRLPDKTALANAVKNAETILKNRDDYMPSTIAGLDELTQKAKAVLNKPEATIDEVTAELNSLTQALAKVRVKEDRTALLNAIDKANKLDAEKYTVESYAFVKGAAAKAVLTAENGDATKAEIENALADLNGAMDNLVPVQNGGNGDVPTGDGSMLPAALVLVVSLLGAAVLAMCKRKQQDEANK